MMKKPGWVRDAPRGLVLTSILVMAAACGESDGQAPLQTATVVDSAGVEIVYSPVPVWDAETAWTVSEAPDITIGTADGSEDYTLYGVRAAIRLDDGRVAIANQGLSQVKIYGATGEHLQNLGRRGEGPGEFGLLMDVWQAPGDSIVAADNALARLTVFDIDGAVGRTIPLQQGEVPRQLFGRRTLEDGTLLVSAAVRASEPPGLGLFDGGIREFDRYSADGKPLNRIAALPHGQNWGFEGSFGRGYTSAPFSIFSPPNASAGKTVFLGDGTRTEVSQWTPEGRLLRIIRWGAEPRQVTPALEEAYRARRLDAADTPEQRQMSEQRIDGIVFPEHLPVYGTLRTDSEDHLWVQPYAPDWEASANWWVFGPGGQWLGEVQLPEGVNLLEIGPDYILGVIRDEADVERVVMHRLTRDPAN